MSSGLHGPILQGQKRKYPRMWLSHISVLKVQPLCKLMLPKKDLEQSILQDSRPVMFVSRALTGAEKNYQILERECLATIWGMEKFHYFLYGKQFILETDQKPLVSIYRKHMVEISPRIQRLIMRSFPYQPFDIQYRKGMEIPLADALSRVTLTPVEEDGIQLPIVAVNLIMSKIPVSSTEIELIHEETSKDPTLTLLRHYIHMGWPIDCRMLPQELHTFWNYREDLSKENGLITKGARLLIPSTLRRKVLEQIHDGHLCIEKCMLKARDSVFWPGISNDFRETVEKCGICQASFRAAKLVGNVSDVPPHAWYTLGTDLFYWNKMDYLVIGDYFSKFLIVRRLPNSSTHAVIKELGLVFTELGRPFVLRSDNRPCYSSREFHNFLSFYQVDHITSSPHYPTKQWICWSFGGNHQETDGKISERRKTMELWPICSIGPHLLVLLFHPHWRCWQGEDHVQPFHNFHPVLARIWKPPEFEKNCLGGNPTTLPQEPWIWSLDNQFLSRKWMETFGEQPLLTNQQLSLIPIGWDFQTIPYWEGPDQWLSQGLHLLILSFRLKHNRGTLKDKLTHVLLTPSTSWMNTQCCLLHQWQVWPHQQQLIGAAKLVKITDPISSTETPQPTVRGAVSSSLPSVSSSLPSTPPRCSTRSTKGVPPVCYTPSKKWMDYSGCFMCARVQWKVLGLLVVMFSVLQYGLVKHGTMWNIPHL